MDRVWCRELGKPELGLKVQLHRFDEMPEPSQRLVQGWWKRAADCRDDKQQAFESFIYSWVAFNAWGECVSGIERDQDWVTAVSASSDVRKLTEEAIVQSGAAAACRRFFGMWPIFKLSELRRAGVANTHLADRTALVAAYTRAGANPDAPKCWKRHEGDCPLDWPHLLAAVYRVRNNLFHGTKVVDSEMDSAIVAAACSALREVVDASGLFVGSRTAAATGE